MKNKKTLITTLGELEFCKIVMTKKEFNEGFEMSTGLINKLAAKDGLEKLKKTDRALTSKELKEIVF